MPIEQLPYKKCFLFCFILTVSSATLNFGYAVGAFSTTTESLKAQYEWDEDEETTYISVITTMVPVGATFGVLLAGKILGYGRWFTYVLMTIIIKFLPFYKTHIGMHVAIVKRRLLYFYW